jgi:hypothetical protein
MNNLQTCLKRLGACQKGLEWAGRHDDVLDAWWACPRGDWLLWLAVKLGVARRTTVFAACECARVALPFTEDERVRTAIILAEQKASGDRDVGIEDLLVAAEDCREAALDAGCYADYAGANSAYAAMYCVKSAMTPGRAKEEAAAVAEAVAEAAADAASSQTEGDKARIVMHLVCSYIVRNRIDDDHIVSPWRRRFCAVKQ